MRVYAWFLIIALFYELGSEIALFKSLTRGRAPRVEHHSRDNREMEKATRKAIGWGLLVAFATAGLIVAGSRNLSHFDAALVGYTFAVLFATFAITYRYAMWLQRPPTALYWKRGWQVFFRPNYQYPEPRVEMHPQMAEKFSIKDGNLTLVESRRGQMELRAMVVTTIRSDTVFIPYHWAGVKCANQLTISAQDPISKIPEYKVCAVRIR
jgi:formylmethanofuran dehydrogenase subunit D